MELKTTNSSWAAPREAATDASPDAFDPDRYALRPAACDRTPAMRTYRTLLVSGALAALAVAATMIVPGDWQAALAAFAAITGGAFLLSLTRLLAIGERLAWPAPSAPRRRAPARPAPASAAVVDPVLTRAGRRTRIRPTARPGGSRNTWPARGPNRQGSLTAIGPDRGVLSLSQPPARRIYKPRMPTPHLR
jgi:hypothetical protein